MLEGASFWIFWLWSVYPWSLQIGMGASTGSGKTKSELSGGMLWSQKHTCLWSPTKADFLDTCRFLYVTSGLQDCTPQDSSPLEKNPWSDSIYWTRSSNPVNSECVLRVSGWSVLLISYPELASSSPGNCNRPEPGQGDTGNRGCASHRDLSSSTTEQHGKGRHLTSAREVGF